MVTLQRLRKRGERAQASIEFISIAPLVFLMYLFMLMLAMIWHGHHLSSQLALEAASGAGVSPAYGAGRVATVVSNWGADFMINVSGYERVVLPKPFIGEALIVRVSGQEPPYAIFGVQNTGGMLGRVAAPIWEFAP